MYINIENTLIASKIIINNGIVKDNKVSRIVIYYFVYINIHCKFISLHFLIKGHI